MCKTHWNAYTSALRKSALARKAAAEVDAVAEPIKKHTKRPPKAVTPEAGSQGDAG